jgi:hypothetical protein
MKSKLARRMTAHKFQKLVGRRNKRAARNFFGGAL